MPRARPVGASPAMRSSVRELSGGRSLSRTAGALAIAPPIPQQSRGGADIGCANSPQGLPSPREPSRKCCELPAGNAPRIADTFLDGRIIRTRACRGIGFGGMRVGGRQSFLRMPGRLNPGRPNPLVHGPEAGPPVVAIEGPDMELASPPVVPGSRQKRPLDRRGKSAPDRPVVDRRSGHGCRA
jgi:hypothetical protein